MVSYEAHTPSCAHARARTHARMRSHAHARARLPLSPLPASACVRVCLLLPFGPGRCAWRA
eukprot:6186175-Pleurochrysis_carterae.AAC.1